MQAFDRTALLIGEENLKKLTTKSVAVFGIGGVGGFTVEALVRSGVQKIAIFDSDKVSLTNINRQIIALTNKVGLDKTAVMKDRILSINPKAEVECNNIFYLPENADSVDLTKYDYIVDAIDTVSSKLELISRAKNLNIPIISCMGTGGKLHPELLKVDYIENTKGCPLARVIRRELKAKNISKVKVVYSEEECKMDASLLDTAEKKDNGRVAPASMVFVPSVAGILLAKEVVLDLIKN